MEFIFISYEPVSSWKVKMIFDYSLRHVLKTRLDLQVPVD